VAGTTPRKTRKEAAFTPRLPGFLPRLLPSFTFQVCSAAHTACSDKVRHSTMSESKFLLL